MYIYIYISLSLNKYVYINIYILNIIYPSYPRDQPSCSPRRPRFSSGGRPLDPRPCPMRCCPTPHPPSLGANVGASLESHDKNNRFNGFFKDFMRLNGI